MLLALHLAASCAANGDAAQEAPAKRTPPELSLGPVLWAASVEGDVVAGGGEGSEAVLDEPLTFDSGIMAGVELRAGSWSVLADGLYVDFRGSTGDAGALTSEVSIEAAVASIAGAAQLARWPLGHQESGVLELDGYGGARLTSVQLGVETQSVGGGDVDRTWVDPLVGLRTSASWGDVFALRLAGDVGGFGLASDFVWQLTGSVIWRPWRAVGFSAGYRVLDYDFDDVDPGDTLGFDVQLRGPFVALLVRF